MAADTVSGKIPTVFDSVAAIKKSSSGLFIFITVGQPCCLLTAGVMRACGHSIEPYHRYRIVWASHTPTALPSLPDDGVGSTAFETLVLFPPATPAATPSPLVVFAHGGPHSAITSRWTGPALVGPCVGFLLGLVGTWDAARESNKSWERGMGEGYPIPPPLVR